MKIIRPKDIIEMLGISKSTFYEWQNEKSRYYKPYFPQKILLGEKTVGYLEEEIVKYIERARYNIKYE